MSDKSSVVTESLKLTPPIAVTGANFLGVPIADWVSWGMLIYVVVLIVAKMPELFRSLYRMKHFNEWIKERGFKDD